MKNITARLLGFFLLTLSSVFGFTAHSQQTTSTQSSTVRGKISDLSGQSLRVATGSGEVLVRLTELTKIITEAPIKLSDIKSGLYLGTTAQKQADGTFLASEVHVFAEMSGTQ
jgi:hypothetical protein